MTRTKFNEKSSGNPHVLMRNRPMTPTVIIHCIHIDIILLIINYSWFFLSKTFKHTCYTTLETKEFHNKNNPFSSEWFIHISINNVVFTILYLTAFKRWLWRLLTSGCFSVWLPSQHQPNFSHLFLSSLWCGLIWACEDFFWYLIF